MADISQVKLPSGNTYDIKDSAARYWYDNTLWDGVAVGEGDYGSSMAPVYGINFSRLVLIESSSQMSVTNNVCTFTGALNAGSFTPNEDSENFGEPLGTGQVIYLYIGDISGLSNFTSTRLTVASKHKDRTSAATISQRLIRQGVNVSKADLTSNTVYTVISLGGDWTIVGSNSSAELSDLIARVVKLENAMIQGVQYVGVLDETMSTDVYDGSSVTQLTLRDGTTVYFDDGSSGHDDPSDRYYGPGAIVILPSANGEPSKQFIWNGTTWEELGSNTENFGDFAYADTGSGTYSKATSVSKPTFSGTPATITVSGKATGSVSKPTFSGTAATITSKGNLAGHTIKIPYTPAGTVGIDTNISTASKNLTVITGVGSLPTTSSQTVVTGLPTTTGKLISAFSTTSINKVTARGSLPTTAAQDVVTGFSEGLGKPIAEYSTTSVGKVTGLGTLPAATSGTVHEVASISNQTVSTAQIYSMTSTGSVTTATVKTISGLGSLPTTESKTFVTDGTGITGVGSLPSSGNATVGTSLTAGTLPTASTGSSWATVTDEVLTLTPVLVSFNAGAFPTLNTTVIKQITGLGSLPTTAALSTSTVRGVTSIGALPSSANSTVVTATTLPGRTASTVVSSVSAASLVTTAEKSVLTNFDPGTLPTCSSQKVVADITLGSLPTATVSTLPILTGLGSLMSTSAQDVVSAITTAERNANTTSIKQVAGVGSLPTTGTESLSYVTAVGATGSLSGTPTTLSYTLPATTITSTASYTPAGTVSQPTWTPTVFNSTGTYTPAGTVSQPTLSTVASTVLVSPFTP